MNNVYRLIWCARTQTWVPIPEVSKSRGSMGSSVVGATKGGTLEAMERVGRAGLLVSTALAMILAISGQSYAGQPPAPNQLPTGGQVSAGSAAISQSGNTMNITQSSQRAAINWSSFNIGSGATVNFVQPNSSSVALNRIQGNSASQIFGHLNANGQVFITNPNGVYFAPGASVDVGSFLATTHTITDSNFMAGNYLFNRNGATGSVVNDGSINAGLGGYIALLAPEVRNNGVVVAQMGTVALAAGEAYQLQFGSNNALSDIIVTPATIAALVQNGNAVQAPGGLIILSAQAADRLQGGVVNTSGTLEASGITSNGGVIKLSASDKIQVSGGINADAAANSAGNGGTVSIIANLANAGSNTQVDGSISARGGNLGGDGGFVETSGGKVSIGNGTRVNTSAPKGKAGTWLLDPDGFTIAASGGDMMGATLSTNLGLGDVAIASTSGSGSDGNINVNDTVSWSSHKLTLTATNDVDINAVMTATGTASVALAPGSNNVNMGLSNGSFTGQLNFNSTGTFQMNIANTLTTFTVINSLGTAADANSSGNNTLQGMANSGMLAGNYVLGSNIAAGGTSTWNSNAGFTPIGSAAAMFTGSFDGLGHTITSLTMNSSSTRFVGLFGLAYLSPFIRNVGLDNADVTGTAFVGALAGKFNLVSVRNSYSTGSVAGTVTGWNGQYGVGGLIGAQYGYTSSISNSFSAASVYGNKRNIGGLAGFANGTISNSYATGTVTAVGGATNVGGLIGVTDNNTTVSNSYATGNVIGSGVSSENFGGLIGMSWGPVSNSYAHGDVTVTGTGVSFVGGLAGINYGTITASHATGNVTGASYAGGLVGQVNQGTVDSSYSTGNVTGTVNNIGGLVGGISGGTVTNSHYDVDAVQINGIHQVTPFGLYSSQYNDWFPNKQAPVITNYSATLVPCYGNPVCYRISTVQGLKDLLGFTDLSGKYFWITTELTLPSGLWYPTFSSILVGADPSGYNHLLSGLDVNQPYNSKIGLIGYLAPTGMVSNLAVSGTVTGKSIVGGLVGSDYGNIANSSSSVNVTGEVFVGGLVGEGGSSTISISNSHATGTITATANNQGDAGGLVGEWSFGSISNSYATGAVSGHDTVGGLLGYIGYGSVSNSYATGNVSGTDTNIGGLIGKVSQSTVDQSYATGTVTGNGLVGGLAGYNYGGTITNSYASGAVSGTDMVGGLVGKNYGVLQDLSNWIFNTVTTTIGTSYARGAVTGTTNVGGLVGWSGDAGASIITTSFYDSTVNPTLTGLGSDGTNTNPANVAGVVWGMSTAAMKTPGNYTGATGTNGNSNPNWNFSSIWGFDTQTPGYPCLQGGTCSGSSSSSSSSGGSSSSGSSSGSSSSGGSSGGSASSGSSGGSSSSGSSSGGFWGGPNIPSSSSGAGSSSSGGAYVPPLPPLPSTPVPLPSSPLTGGASSSGGIAWGPASSGSSAGGGNFGFANPSGSSGGSGNPFGGEPAAPPSLGGGGLPTGPVGGEPEGMPVAASSSGGTASISRSQANNTFNNGQSSNGGNSMTPGSTVMTSTGISITLVQSPSVQQSGAIAVTVPKGMAVSGTGFSFALPTQVVQVEAGAAPVQVTTTSGTPLPAWLHYSPDSHTIVATAVPDGGLPIQVVVTVNGASSTIVISEGAQ